MGSRLAVDHVAGLGHERIACVAGPQNVSTGHRRYLGFLAAMEHHGLPAPAERIGFAGAFAEGAGAEVCAGLLAADPGVTAIVAANDLLAMGCYEALTARGVACPDGVSIIGFNDMPFIDKLHPPLTSVRVPQREIGFAAAGLLLDLLGDEPPPPREVTLDPTLIVRGSTAPPRTRG
jgi:LacI family transcriptional regulator